MNLRDRAIEWVSENVGPSTQSGHEVGAFMAGADTASLALNLEVARLIRALEWYSLAVTWTDPQAMIMSDLGAVARRALDQAGAPKLAAAYVKLKECAEKVVKPRNGNYATDFDAIHELDEALGLIKRLEER